MKIASEHEKCVVSTDPALELGTAARMLIDAHNDALNEGAAFDIGPDEVLRRYTAMTAELISTPAETLAGLVAKLRVLEEHTEDGKTDHADPLLESIIADAERLAGGAS